MLRAGRIGLEPFFCVFYFPAVLEMCILSFIQKAFEHTSPLTFFPDALAKMIM